MTVVGESDGAIAIERVNCNRAGEAKGVDVVWSDPDGRGVGAVEGMSHLAMPMPR